jgi:hypothetical protein
MTNPATAAKNAVEIGKKHILDQQFRIVRQRELIEKLQGDQNPDAVADARRILAEMEQTRATMEAHYAAAQEGLAQDTVDWPSLAKVERDTPM